MITYPNQNIIVIKKTPCKANFLQINKDEWTQAAKTCNFSAFKMYLYLAGNEIGYEKALSKEAVEKEIGIKKTSYYDAVKNLENLGYLRKIGGNKFEFYTSPFRSSGKEEKDLNSAVAESEYDKQVINSALAEINSDSNSVVAENNKNPNSALAESYYTFDF